jgi:HPt (histidine-containing phosphotransfer) domain-containing protein
MNTACLDPEVVADLRDVADDSFLEQVLMLYIEQALDVIASLRQALAAADAVTFKRAAHKLAGASLNIGATRMTTKCREIEKAGEVTAAHIVTIENELAHLYSELAL